MLNDAERIRVNELEQERFKRTLKAEELRELSELVSRETGPDDDAILAAAERNHQETLRLQSEREALEQLVARKERLANKLERLLAERASIDRDLARLVGGAQSTGRTQR